MRARQRAPGADGVDERRQPGAALAVVDRRQLHRGHPFVERLFERGLGARAGESVLRGRVDEAVERHVALGERLLLAAVEHAVDHRAERAAVERHGELALPDAAREPRLPKDTLWPVRDNLRRRLGENYILLRGAHRIRQQLEPTPAAAHPRPIVHETAVLMLPRAGQHDELRGVVDVREDALDRLLLLLGIRLRHGPQIEPHVLDARHRLGRHLALAGAKPRIREPMRARRELPFTHLAQHLLQELQLAAGWIRMRLAEPCLRDEDAVAHARRPRHQLVEELLVREDLGERQHLGDRQHVHREGAREAELIDGLGT